VLVALLACRPAPPPGDAPGTSADHTAEAPPTCELPAVELVGDAELRPTSEPPAPGGRFDPSPVFPGGGPEGYVSYSIVHSLHGEELLVNTHVAATTDGGRTWRWLAQVNANEPVTLGCPDAPCVTNHEVSSLLYDPTDAPARRWKLAAHTYLVTETELLYAHGRLSRWTAPDPAGPWTAADGFVGWPSPAPLSSAASTSTTELDGLGDCLFLTEPSLALDRDGVVHLAVGCVSSAAGDLRIDLLTSGDHGERWTHQGTMLTADDGRDWGFDARQVNAAHLFEVDGDKFVSASPSGDVGGFEGYRGCYVVALGDDGLPQRCDDGRARVVQVLDRAGEPFLGACAWTEGLAPDVGWLVPTLHPSEVEVFRTHLSGISPPRSIPR
jgi:hypothetical protein